jgi:hypothetical protein
MMKTNCLINQVGNIHKLNLVIIPVAEVIGIRLQETQVIGIEMAGEDSEDHQEEVDSLKETERVTNNTSIWMTLRDSKAQHRLKIGVK